MDPSFFEEASRNYAIYEKQILDWNASPKPQPWNIKRPVVSIVDFSINGLNFVANQLHQNAVSLKE